MAIELGRINVNDLAENDYKSLGIGFGRKSNSNGIFAVNYTTLTQAKDNLINLILTKKGEAAPETEEPKEVETLDSDEDTGEDEIDVSKELGYNPGEIQ